jgi:hypothetical protein
LLLVCIVIGNWFRRNNFTLKAGFEVLTAVALKCAPFGGETRGTVVGGGNMQV